MEAHLSKACGSAGSYWFLDFSAPFLPLSQALLLPSLTWRCSPASATPGPLLPWSPKIQQVRIGRVQPNQVASANSPLQPLSRALPVPLGDPTHPELFPASPWRLCPSANALAFPHASWTSQPGHDPIIPNSTNLGLGSSCCGSVDYKPN